MSNEEQWIFTCRFPGWEENGHKFEAFGVEYLVTTPVYDWPDWEENDERWLTYDESAEVVAEFERQYKSKIGKDFDGEILFVKKSQLVVL